MKSVSVTQRAREHAPQAKTGMCLATTLSSVSVSGGQPTGKIALTMDLRSNEVASARRKIWTSCPASASTSPCAKGNAALVGSSGPQALFIIIFSFFGGGCALAAPKAQNGTPATPGPRRPGQPFSPLTTEVV